MISLADSGVIANAIAGDIYATTLVDDDWIGRAALILLGTEEGSNDKHEQERDRFHKGDTPLPESLSIESEAFLPGWRVVRNLDRAALARNIESARWYFFYLAGEMRATVVGRDRP